MKGDNTALHNNGEDPSVDRKPTPCKCVEVEGYANAYHQGARNINWYYLVCEEVLENSVFNVSFIFGCRKLFLVW